MKYTTYKLFSFLFVLSALLAVSASAQTRQMFPFSGTTTTLADGTYDLTFKLYDQDFPGGNILYSENRSNVSIDTGAFNAVLGPIPINVFTARGGSVYIATEQTGISGEIGPRVPIYSSGFAHTFNPGASVSGNIDGPILSLSNTGRGAAASFLVNNFDNDNPVLAIRTQGGGPAGVFDIGRSFNSSNVITARTIGTGRAGFFESMNPNAFGPALEAVTTSDRNPAFLARTIDGGGSAGVFEISSLANASSALYASTNGTGPAGDFRISNARNDVPALRASTSGMGPALRASTLGTGPAGEFRIDNANSRNNVLQAFTFGTSGSGGVFQIVNATNPSSVLGSLTTGTGHAGDFWISNPSNNNSALHAVTNGSGWAGEFEGLGSASKGVRISVPAGQPGLQVIGGSKNAVVATSKGARAVYSEESSEVWFTDYGFGRLQKGVARIEIDPMFAETVNPNEPYHVFVQLNDLNCEGVAVVNKTASSFEVMELRNGHSNAEFSYRLVAKRRGFEQKRLEQAPWADGDPNVYP